MSQILIGIVVLLVILVAAGYWYRVLHTAPEQYSVAELKSDVKAGATKVGPVLDNMKTRIQSKLAAVEDNFHAQENMAGSCWVPSWAPEETSPGCEYAKYPYGGPGATYTDFIKSQSIDENIVKNHAAFVADVSDTTSNKIGATFSPDSHDSYDPIPWIGIRGRPQAVPICNPDQVADVDTSLYAQGPVLSWHTG